MGLQNKRKTPLRSLPSLVLTPGDPGGIGPEVTVKAIAALKALLKRENVHLILIGNLGAHTKELEKLKINYSYMEIPHRGQVSAQSCGEISGRALEIASGLILSGKAHSLITGPISKERLRLAGFPYDGHTEFLKDLSKVPAVTMMLSNPIFSVSLVTTHVALQNVSKLISVSKIEGTLLRTIEFLKTYRGIDSPLIRVCGLNPHCGENGLLGNEETMIKKAIQLVQKQTKFPATIEGPFASDTLFAKEISLPKSKKAHAIVAMYHDQGLTPVKLVDFPNTINLTCGLPYLRTSVDHGTAFDIAGKNKADSSSMQKAILFALTHLKRSV